MIQNHPAVLFARSLIPFFECNPMFHACVPLSRSIGVEVTPPDDIDDPGRSKEIARDYSVLITLFPETTKKSSAIGTVSSVEHPAEFTIDCTGEEVAAIKRNFLSLYGGSTIQLVSIFGDLIGDELKLIDCEPFKTTTYYSIGYTIGNPPKLGISIADIEASDDLLEQITEYRVNDVNPMMTLAYDSQLPASMAQ